MTNLMLCVGSRGSTPFDWDILEVRVQSVEELCFQIVRNRYVISEDAFSTELFDWLERECGLAELAEILRRHLAKKASAYEMVRVILEYVQYNTEEEIQETLRVLREASDMDLYEKHLARADYLVESEHYSRASDAYDKLRKETPADDYAKQAELLIAEGVMNARMFSFARAAELFRKAYEIQHDKKTYLHYLAAMRMQMGEKEYLDFVADDTKAYQLSMPLESAISEAEEAYGKSREHQTIKQLMKSRADGQMNEYYDMVHVLTEELKKEYRGSGGVVAKD